MSQRAILTTASADQLQQEKRLSDAIASINDLEVSLSNAQKKIDLASSAFAGQAKSDEETGKANLYSLFDQWISFLDVFKENYSYGLGVYEQNNAQATIRKPTIRKPKLTTHKQQFGNNSEETIRKPKLTSLALKTSSKRKNIHKK